MKLVKAGDKIINKDNVNYVQKITNGSLRIFFSSGLELKIIDRAEVEALWAEFESDAEAAAADKNED